ncbi:SDR family NAD(P)-dependent oxidoreductase, partial [Phenylobacterium sp.]|jgi:NAD(P)-dependent dehydrogenase (short-subunit alcohol dehydrogenase family)|uniref:SDR family NAD(P)-dependent oxidoreductase n=1 Tax=Phenylobacterium sp. TaxID=1871053 RepID=UPI0037C9388F
VKALGRKAKAYQASIDDYEQDKAMIDAVAADFGRLDILVHNAGIASRGRSVVDTDPSEPQRLFATHAQGAHHLAALALPHIRKQDRGDVIVISSVATLGHAANGAPYNMAKAALEALAYTLAKEERPNGVFVNIVAPGLVDTDMGQKLARATMGADDIHVLDSRMPFGHVCQPEEVAAVVRFLVSPANSYVTGEKINVHGGGR